MNPDQTQQTSKTTPAQRGTPWQFRFVIIVIAASVLVILAKALGLF